MDTSAEKRALIFVAALAALGVSVRAFRAGHRTAPDTSEALDRQLAAVDSAVASRDHRTAGRGRPKSSPRRARDDSSATSALRNDALRAPTRRAEPAPVDAWESRRREVADGNRAAQQRLDALNDVIRVTPNSSPARGRSDSLRPSASRNPSPSPVDLDTADESTIAGVPWIGPALAARIVRDRTRNGTFGSIEGLQRVAGIGAGLAARIARHVLFSGSGMGPPKVMRFRKVRP